MPHAVAGRTLGRRTEHRLALYRNLVADVIKKERIKTTEAKAKEVRGQVERVITYGKKGSLHHRRLALAFVPDKEAVEKVFQELATRYAQRPGGYTRIVKLGPRKGDAAPMVFLELVS